MTRQQWQDNNESTKKMGQVLDNEKKQWKEGDNTKEQ
jgi:hypothetical protein